MSQSNTELAAQARRLAIFLSAMQLDAPKHREGLSEASLAFLRCAAALESPERVQGDEAATDPEDCNAWCPRCNGHGHDVEMSDSSPDAHEVMVNCRHCDGQGTLYAAYTGVVRELAKKHQAYMKACGELYFAKHAVPTPPTAPAQDAQSLMRPEVLIDGNAESAHVQETLTPSNRSRSATPSPQAATAGARTVTAMYSDSRGMFLDFSDGTREFYKCEIDHEIEDDCPIPALRASTPAESVPLSEQQVYALTRRIGLGGNAWLRLARVIEAAHGIKESSNAS